MSLWRLRDLRAMSRIAEIADIRASRLDVRVGPEADLMSPCHASSTLKGPRSSLHLRRKERGPTANPWGPKTWSSGAQHPSKWKLSWASFPSVRSHDAGPSLAGPLRSFTPGDEASATCKGGRRRLDGSSFSSFQTFRLPALEPAIGCQTPSLKVRYRLGSPRDRRPPPLISLKKMPRRPDF